MRCYWMSFANIGLPRNSWLRKIYVTLPEKTIYIRQPNSDDFHRRRYFWYIGYWAPEESKRFVSTHTFCKICGWELEIIRLRRVGSDWFNAMSRNDMWPLTGDGTNEAPSIDFGWVLRFLNSSSRIVFRLARKTNKWNFFCNSRIRPRVKLIY